MVKHSFELVVAGIAVEALCKDAKFWKQAGIEQTFLSIGEFNLPVEQLKFGAVVALSGYKFFLWYFEGCKLFTNKYFKHIFKAFAR